MKYIIFVTYQYQSAEMEGATYCNAAQHRCEINYVGRSSYCEDSYDEGNTRWWRTCQIKTCVTEKIENEIGSCKAMRMWFNDIKDKKFMW